MVKVILKPTTEGQKPVELPVGKTVLGRGPLLGCTDKKVSRNHAVLDVTTKGNVFLTPIHVNPCFYRTKTEDSLRTMKKDHIQQLYPGDIISLLPTTFEYEVCLDVGSITGEKENNKTTVPTKYYPNASEENAVAKEEPMEETTQFEKNDNNKDFTTNNSNERPSDDEQDENSYESTKPLVANEIEAEKLEDERPSVASSGKKEAVTIVPTTKSKTLRHRRTLPSWLVKCSAQGSSVQVVEKVEKAQPRKVTTPVRSRTTKTGGAIAKQAVSRSSRENRQTRQKISLDDFVVSEDDQWNSGASDKQGGVGSKTDSEWESEESSSSDWDVKKRKRRGRGDSSESDWGAANLRKRRITRDDDSESGSDWETENRKKARKSKGRRAKKKSDSDDSDRDTGRRRRRATTSTSKRTSCMYGKKCYRRQPQHVSKFSHPGDSDYESPDDDDDDDDDKESIRECPYGVDCYRKNPQHRKEFTHTKKVRPKREAAKNAGKKKNEDEEDGEDSRDVDLSFENDSDAYAPESEVSGAGSETEDLVKDSKKVLMNRKKAV